MSPPLAGTPTPPFRDFPVFDALLIERKPDLVAEYGFDPLVVLYAHDLWPHGASRAEPNEQWIRQRARQVPEGSLVCLDIEHWPWVTNGRVNEKTMRKMIRVIDVFREENPNVKLGYYATIPPWVAMAAANPGHTASDSAHRESIIEGFQPLIEKVDVLFPSAYTWRDNPEMWEAGLRETVKTLRPLGKPIYPFLWPLYHPKAHDASLRHEPIPKDFWQAQLAATQQYADGMVIWGMGRYAWPQAKASPWFKEVVRMIQSKDSAVLWWGD